MKVITLPPFLLKYTGLFLFLGMCLLGLLTFPLYGMCWDEPLQRAIGEVNWKYVFLGDESLFTYPGNDHGVAFELPLLMLEKALGLEATRSIYLMRHLVTHVYFLLGAWFCYKLVDLLYANKFLSIVGFLLFVLHPHIYAHSFFNTKDLPFLSTFMICFYLCARTFRDKTIVNTLLLGGCMGLLINMRMMGVLLLCCVLFFFVLDAIREKKILRHLLLIFLILASGLFTLCITWPYLWREPVAHFSQAFKSMSHFDWPLTNLFDGELVPANKLGWNYIPVWFSITTPIPYLLAGAFGILAASWFFIRNPLAGFKDLRTKCNILFLACFFVPVIAVVVLRSVLYDGWRHLFFIYPSFLMLIIFALHILYERYRKWLYAGATMAFVFVGGFMVLNAPFQHTYFNYFLTNHSAEYIRKHYELDYWGTSYKQALEYILENDTAKVIPVYVTNYPGFFNYECLPLAQRDRLTIVHGPEVATYFVSNFRWHPQDYPFENKRVYSIKVLNNTINAVYKLK